MITDCRTIMDEMEIKTPRLYNYGANRRHAMEIILRHVFTWCRLSAALMGSPVPAGPESVKAAQPWGEKSNWPNKPCVGATRKMDTWVQFAGQLSARFPIIPRPKYPKNLSTEAFLPLPCHKSKASFTFPVNFACPPSPKVSCGWPIGVAGRQWWSREAPGRLFDGRWVVSWPPPPSPSLLHSLYKFDLLMSRESRPYEI